MAIYATLGVPEAPVYLTDHRADPVQPGDWFEVIRDIGGGSATPDLGKRFKAMAITQHCVYGEGAPIAYFKEEVRRLPSCALCSKDGDDRTEALYVHEACARKAYPASTARASMK